MLAEIITIGDEILIGQIIDSNSAWLGQKLNDAGIKIKQITSLSDDREHILAALREAQNRADIILITGGLGPTKDDITKKTLAEFFDMGFRRDEATLKHVTRIFEKSNRPMLDTNIQQADVPEGCTVLLNKQGTAPGMWFDIQGKIFVSMPGVPFEMMYLVEEEVLPRLKKMFSLPVILHHTILTGGLGESFLAKQIEDIENDLPPDIKLAYLPKLGQVRLRLSGTGFDEIALRDKIEKISAQIKLRLGDYVIADLDKPLEKVILDFMAERKLTLSVAESCTGGYISQQITQHPGCSAVFLGGGITYSNHLKTKVIGVSTNTLGSFGAVSEEVVKEMSEGAIETFGSDYSLAVSGVAGPEGGTEEKPVGTVWISVSSAKKTISKKYLFGNRRQQNIERAASNAFVLLYKLLREDHA